MLIEPASSLYTLISAMFFNQAFDTRMQVIQVYFNLC